MLGSYNLKLALILTAFAAFAAMLIDSVSASPSILAARIVSGLFLALAILLALREAARRRGRLGFLHIHIVMTALAWFALAFFTANHYARGDGQFLILSTLFLNLLGLLILLLVVDRFVNGRKAVAVVSWAASLSLWAARLSWPVILATGIVFLILTWLRFSSGLLMSGTGGVMTQVGVIESALLQFSSTVGALFTIIGWLFVFGRDRKRFWIGCGFLFVQIALGFLGGRRVLLSVFVLGGLIWVGLRGISLKRVMAGGAVGLVLVTMAGPLFLELRNTAVQNGLHVVPVEMRPAIFIDSARSALAGFEPFSAFSDGYVDGASARASFLGFTLEIQQRLNDGWSVGAGRFMVISMLEMVPRIIWAEKLQVLGEFRAEQQMQLWFSLPVGDVSPTLLTFAVADGGMIGVVLYYALAGILFGLLYRFMWHANHLIFRFWAAAQIFALCINVETSLAAYIGAGRYLLAFFVLDKMLQLLSAKKVKPIHVKSKGSMPLVSRSGA